MRGSSISTPYLTPLDLDAGLNTPFPSLNELEQKPAEDPIETDAQFLLWQTRLWRVINSAQWVAWGIVQAKVPGMQEGIAAAGASASGSASASASVATPSEAEPSGNPSGAEPDNDPASAALDDSRPPPVDPDIDQLDGFDYLAYSQDRAMFFWADLLALNLIKEEELPREMVEYVKARIIDY